MGCTACKGDRTLDIYNEYDAQMISGWGEKKLIIRHGYNQKEHEKVLIQAHMSLKKIQQKLTHFEVHAADNQFTTQCLNLYLDAASSFKLLGFGVDFSECKDLSPKFTNQLNSFITEQGDLEFIKIGVANNGKVNDEDMKFALESVPNTLKTFLLDISNTELEDRFFRAFPLLFQYCNRLEVFKIKAINVPISDVSMYSLAHMFRKLHIILPLYEKYDFQLDVQLDFKNCEGITSNGVQEIASAIACCQPVSRVWLCFEGCHQTKNFNGQLFETSLYQKQEFVQKKHPVTIDLKVFQQNWNFKKKQTGNF